MEVGEAVAVVVAESSHDDSCYFCKAKDAPDEVENDLVPDPDDDAVGYGGFKNDASKLGNALGAPSDYKVTVDGEELDVTVAAHHLIPGNAALAKSDLFKSKEYLWIDGTKKGNIGYNVNADANGVWLPGNYAISGWSAKQATFQNAYAFAAISKVKAQFHDAHKPYSDFVLEALQKIYEKLEAKEDLGCPEAPKRKEQTPEDRPPLRTIVGRLNTISARMRRMLKAPSQNWKRNIYTSSRSLLYMNTQGHVAPD